MREATAESCNFDAQLTQLLDDVFRRFRFPIAQMPDKRSCHQFCRLSSYSFVHRISAVNPIP